MSLPVTTTIMGIDKFEALEQALRVACQRGCVRIGGRDNRAEWDSSHEKTASVWQIHEVIYENDPDSIFKPDGAAERWADAKRQGKVRFVGFTGHKNPTIHLRMLKHGFPFDTVQMPLNCMDAAFRNFEKTVLPEANRQGVPVFGMKSLGGSGEMVTHGAITAAEGLRYAMSVPVATTISGIDSRLVLDQNLTVASGFRPMEPADMIALRERCRVYSADGRYELYKTTVKYDGRRVANNTGIQAKKRCPYDLSGNLFVFHRRPIQIEANS